MVREHACNYSVNCEASFGALECQAGVDMFLRSIDTRNLRCTVFVGYGDSACYFPRCTGVDMNGD